MIVYTYDLLLPVCHVLHDFLLTKA